MSESSADWQHAWQLFQRLADLPIKQAIAELEQETIPAHVKSRVIKLLENLQHNHTIFDDMGDAFVAEGLGEAIDLSGQVIDGYELLALCGSGGMSSVYQAQRQDAAIQKQVALKIMHPFSLSEQSLRMFEREQQTLATLNHPNIISFHHGGITREGTPYLVTDFVDEAMVVDEYVRARSLSERDIVRLMLDVMAAIHHAHTALVIHRDLKPSNILVDQSGFVRVVDFGIASLDREYHEATTMVFTPEYAAPEQLIGDSISTLVDVFALGAVLLRLLTFETPLPAFGQRRKSPEQDQQHVKKVLSQSGLDRDLRNIIACAMHADPERRYPSVAAFRQDLLNWLGHKTVQATTDSLWYRLRKFVVRRKAVALLLVATCVSLVGGLLLVWQQKGIAEYEAARATEVKQFLLRALSQSDPDLTGVRNLSVRDFLQEAQANMTQAQFSDPKLHAELLLTIADSLGKIGEFDQALNLLQQADALAVEQTPVQLLRSELLFESKQFEPAQALVDGLSNQAINDLDQVVDMRLLQANLLDHQGAFEDAEAHLRKTLQNSALEGRPDLQVALNLALANTLVNQQQQTAAEALLGDTLALSRTALGELNSNTIEVLLELARMHENSSDTGIADSMDYLQQVLDKQQQLYDDDHPKILATRIRLANNHRALGNKAQALALANQAKTDAEKQYGSNNVYVARANVTLSNLALQTGDLNQAIGYLQQAVSVFENIYGQNHFETNQYKTNLASYLLKVDRADEALLLLDALYASQEQQLGPHHMATLYVQMNQVKALTALGRLTEAINLGQQILPVSEQHLGPEQAVTLGMRLALGLAHYEQSNHAAAIDLLSSAEQSLTVRSNPAYHEQLLRRLISSYIAIKAPEPAQRYLDQLLSLPTFVQPAASSDETTEAISLQQSIDALREVDN